MFDENLYSDLNLIFIMHQFYCNVFLTILFRTEKIHLAKSNYS